MLSIYDNDTFAAALAQPITAELDKLLRSRWASAGSVGLQDCTYIMVIQAGDEEAEVEQEIGFRPTVSPSDGAHYGTLEFCPFWSWLKDVGGWYEMIVTIGNDGFAFILLIEKGEGVPRAVLDMCDEYDTDLNPSHSDGRI